MKYKLSDIIEKWKQSEVYLKELCLGQQPVLLTDEYTKEKTGVISYKELGSEEYVLDVTTDYFNYCGDWIYNGIPVYINVKEYGRLYQKGNHKINLDYENDKNLKPSIHFESGKNLFIRFQNDFISLSGLTDSVISSKYIYYKRLREYLQNCMGFPNKIICNLLLIDGFDFMEIENLLDYLSKRNIKYQHYIVYYFTQNSFQKMNLENLCKYNNSIKNKVVIYDSNKNYIPNNCIFDSYNLDTFEKKYRLKNLRKLLYE